KAHISRDRRRYNQLVEWLRQSAERDFPASQWMMAELASRTPAKDDIASFNWMKRAAVFEMAFAHEELAERYANGIGVEQDLEEAYFWGKVAAKETAARKLELDPIVMRFFTYSDAAPNKLAAQINPERRVEIDGRVNAWQPRQMPEFGTLTQIPGDGFETP